MQKNGMDWIWDLIWIEIEVFKNFKECAHSPCNGNHFSSGMDRIRIWEPWQEEKSLLF